MINKMEMERLKCWPERPKLKSFVEQSRRDFEREYQESRKLFESSRGFSKLSGKARACKGLKPKKIRPVAAQKIYIARIAVKVNMGSLSFPFLEMQQWLINVFVQAINKLIGLKIRFGISQQHCFSPPA